MRPSAIAPVVLLLVSSLLAQSSQFAYFGGVVKDNTGAPIPGVAVELVGLADGVRRSVVTNDRGVFDFGRVPVGTYSVTANLPGFVAYRGQVRLNADAREQLTIELKIGALTETVMVAAQGAPGQTARSMAFADFNTESYAHIKGNAFRKVKDHPLSTFSIDVDTASYANVRRFLGDGQLPPADAVRVEELINYFKFDYPKPAGSAPFAVSTELGRCPWNTRHYLALVGLQAKVIESDAVPPRNLVFLLDVSGSMNEPNKLPLVKSAMTLLVNTLRHQDRVAIVVYAGDSGLALRSTEGTRKDVIRDAIASLEPGGSTNGAGGIILAYQIAAENFIKGGVNRVILATDGDFNVGVTSDGELVRLIEEKRETGVFLSVLGVGEGNLKDSKMEQLADKGNGNYSYLDTLHEAHRLLVAEAGGTLVTVAKDVKLQVEFNPRTISAYRLIGYENRLLENEDFNDDRKDAGDMGAGHSVTALYEIVPRGTPDTVPSVDPLKYQEALRPAGGSQAAELMTIKVRYKAPDAGGSQLLAVTIKDAAAKRELSANLGFAAAVAEFGMLLRDSEHRGEATYDSARDLGKKFKGEDADGYRGEFVRMVEIASGLQRRDARNHSDRKVAR